MNRPAVVAGVVALLGIGGALAYSGPGAASVAYCLIIDGGIGLLRLAAAAGWGAWPTFWCLRRGGFTADALLGLITSTAIGLGFTSLLILGLGLAGGLNRLAAIALLVIGLALGAAWLWRHYASRAAGRPTTEPHASWHWLWLAVAPLLAAAIISAMFPPGMLWKPDEPHGYDAISYHLQVPREWFEAGRITPLQHNVYSYFPFGTEMHYLLAMHLKGDPTARGGAWPAMYLCQLMHLAMTVLAALAAGGFANRVAQDRRIAIAAGIAGASVPFLAQVSALAFNDGALLLFGTLSVGWTVLALRKVFAQPSSGRSVAPFILPGLLAGFSAGVKLTGVPLFILAIPAALLLILARLSWGHAMRSAMTFGTVAVVAMSPWLIRNTIWCGNPVFPEGTAIFGKAHFTDVQQERWKRAHAAQPNQQSIGGRLAAFGNEVLGNWQFGYVLVPLGAAAIGVCWRRREMQFLALLLLLHALFWLGMTHLQGRFFLSAVPLAVLALAMVQWESFPPALRRHGPAALAGAVAVMAVVGWWNLHRPLQAALTGLHTDTGGDARGALLANDQIDWLAMKSVLADFPADDPSAELLVIGDAQMFWYSLPMSRLKYRTPFDVAAGPEISAIDAYGVAGRSDHTWVRVDPAELGRFARTYQPFPSVPAPWIPAEAPFEVVWPYVVRPGEKVIRDALMRAEERGVAVPGAPIPPSPAR
jgi:hypothetical protein